MPEIASGQSRNAVEGCRACMQIVDTAGVWQVSLGLSWGKGWRVVVGKSQAQLGITGSTYAQS